jgi:hypothetical protein
MFTKTFIVCNDCTLSQRLISLYNAGAEKFMNTCNKRDRKKKTKPEHNYSQFREKKREKNSQCSSMISNGLRLLIWQNTCSTRPIIVGGWRRVRYLLHIWPFRFTAQHSWHIMYIDYTFLKLLSAQGQPGQRQ